MGSNVSKTAAGLRAQLDKVRADISGLPSTRDPRYGALKTEEARIDAELRKANGTRRRERVAAIGRAIMGPAVPENAGTGSVLDAANQIESVIAQGPAAAAKQNMQQGGEFVRAPGSGIFSQKPIVGQFDRGAAVAKMANEAPPGPGQPVGASPMSMPGDPGYMAPFMQASPDTVKKVLDPVGHAKATAQAVVAATAPQQVSNSPMAQPGDPGFPQQQPQQPGQPQTQPDPRGAQIEADFSALKDLIATPMPGMMGPVPLSAGERISAGLIAAFDPESYRMIVLPELGRRQQEAAMRYEAERAASQARINNAASMLGLRLKQQADEADAAYKDGLIGIEEAKAAREKSDVVLKLGGMLGGTQNLEKRVALVAKGLERVGLPEQAAMIRSKYGDVAALAGAMSRPENISKGSVESFGGELSSMDKLLTDGFNAIDVRRPKAEDDRGGRGKLPDNAARDDYGSIGSILRSAHRARILVEQGSSGWFDTAAARGMAFVGWPGGDFMTNNLELDRQLATVKQQAQKRVAGGNVGPAEEKVLRPIVGVGPGTNKAVLLDMLRQVEEIYVPQKRQLEAEYDFTDETRFALGGFEITHPQMEDMEWLEKHGGHLVKEADLPESSKALGRVYPIYQVGEDFYVVEP